MIFPDCVIFSLSRVDEQIVLFLHSCFYKLEATKNCIESYFDVRTNAPELFANRNPDSEAIREVMDTMYGNC